MLRVGIYKKKRHVLFQILPVNNSLILALLSLIELVDF